MCLDSLCKAETFFHVDLSKERVGSTCWDALEVNSVPRIIQRESSILSYPHQEPVCRDCVTGQAKLYQFSTDRCEECKCPMHWDAARKSGEGGSLPGPLYRIFQPLNREHSVSMQGARDYLSIALNRVSYKSEKQVSLFRLLF